MADHLERKRIYYPIYTLIFALLFFCCFEIYLLRYDKSILWKSDTYEMHYLQFLYLGRWIRTGLQTGRFPLWDPAIGYGADYLASGISPLCDPLNWISIIFPERSAEAGFHLVTALRLYFCGLSFSWFGFRRRQKAYAVLCGAIIYTFCACSYTGLYQSGFLVPMYMLPLLIAGTDELFDRNRPMLYVAALSFCALNSFYITYMLALLIIAYCLLKWCFLKKPAQTPLAFFRVVGRFLLYSSWSAAIAAASLIPAALLMSGMGRLELEQYIPLFYPKSFYAEMYKGFITSYNMLHRDCAIGFSVLALVCLFVFFLPHHIHSPKLKLSFIIMTIALGLPFAGHVMNGFGYITNRWVWAYAFVVAEICTLTIPTLNKLTNQQSLLTVMLCLLYVFVAYILFDAGGNAFLFVSIALLLVSCALFFFPRLSEHRYQRWLVLISCITVILPAYFQYSKDYVNDFRANLPAGTAYETALASNGMPLLNLIDTSDGTRYNSYGLKTVRNASRLYGVSGIDLYDNIYNSNIDNFHNSIALHTDFNNFSYEGLDRRSELLALLGVNHYFMTTDNPYFPVGFDTIEAETDSAGTVLQAATPAEGYSLFTLFSKTISNEDYNLLSPYERQQALLQACVLDLPADSGTDDLNIDSAEIPYTITSEENGTCLTISFPPQDSGELYLYFDNLHYSNGDSTTCKLQIEAFNQGCPIVGSEQSLTIANNKHHMYGGKHNWLLNLGLIPEQVDMIRITFANPNCTYNSLKVYNRAIASIIANLAQLNHDITSVTPAANEYRVTLDCSNEETLFAAIPYDKGWRAYDNGEAVDIQRADVAFMAITFQFGSIF